MMKKWGLLLLILMLAGVVRIAFLDSRPTGFTWDEAALGYNAYSLLKTGRDEYGALLPVVFKSFGDFKPGAYIYFTVPAVALFGLTEFSTRLPSALMGTLLVASVYVLARKLKLSNTVALLTALSLAISPWAIQFSRGAWEANLALLLVVLGTGAFLQRRLSVAAIIWGLSLWSYQGAKLFTPLIAVLCWLVIKNRPGIKALLKPGFLFLVVILPVLVNFSSQSGRLEVYSVFSYTRQANDVAEIMRQDGEVNRDWKYYLWHSEIYDQKRGIIQRYTNYFSPDFLFFSANPTNLRESTIYSGYFLLPQALLLLIGIYQLLKDRSQHNWIIWGWLILAPLPAALSRDLISGVRSLPLMIPLVILMGIGWSTLMKHKWLGSVYMVIMAAFFVYFANLYFIHTPYYAAGDMVSAYGQAWKTVRTNFSDYDRIVFTTKLGQPYIFGLFYMRYDPSSYQKQAILVANASGDVGEVKTFDKFDFRELYWPEDQNLRKTLFVGGQYELPIADINQNTTLTRLGDINYADGNTALRMVGTP